MKSLQYPPIPPDEAQRLAALQRYGLLDTPPESGFDRISALAARLFDVPLALVTLVDSERQWFKSCQGTACTGLGVTETSRDAAFCAYTILSPDVLVVADALRDARFCENPLVTGDPHIRFYAGAPLITPTGSALGALCLIDFQPRLFSAEQQATLKDLAASVVSEMELRRSLQNWSKSERLYRQMFAGSPQPMWVFDSETLQFLTVNEAAVAHYGYSREEFLQMTLCDIRPPEELGHLKEARPGRSQGDGSKGVWRHRKKDGALLWVEVAVHAIDYGGRAARMVAASDVTERVQVEDALRRSEEHLRVVVSNLPVIVWALDAEGVFTLSDGRGLDALGLKPDQLVGSNALELSRDFPELAFFFQEALAGRYRFLAHSVAGVDFETHVAPLQTAHGKINGIIGLSHNVTDRKELEVERETLLAQTEAMLAEALERADHDPLTGLLNHPAFQKRLKQEESSARAAQKPLALLLLDLDNFKFFNDAYGYLAGDDVLRQAAQVFSACCGAGDTLARFGGDEFVLLMPGADREAAACMAEQLHQAVRLIGYDPPGEDTFIPAGLSLGLACLPEDGPGRLDMLEAADARVRIAKSGGDGDSQMLRLRQSMTRSKEGFSMLDALVTAVDNKDRYTRRHSEDVMGHSVRIARELGLDTRVQHIMEVAALLHDVGKIGIPDAILRKPGKLSEEDFEAVRQHPMMGSVIVGAVPGFEEVLDAIRHHHERWDGGGYPFGLIGEETPLTARIMAVADAYSAMTTDRPYRRGMNPARARQILQEGAGTQWDSACVEAFLRDEQD